jgi:hypothetical protein
MITQQDLAEEQMLKLRLEEASGEFLRKRQLIRAALDAGATIEPGLRRAEVKTRRMLVIR